LSTIHDVARLAGVSVSTASNALNAKGYVRESTRQAVLAAAEHLSYRPSGAARNLKLKRSRIIGLIAFDAAGPVHSAIISGAMRRAEENGYEAILCNSHFREDRVLSSLLSYKMLDACVVMSPELDDALLRDLARTTLPIVAIDRDIQGENIGCVMMDDATSGYGIARLFHDRGFREIAYIGPNPVDHHVLDVSERNRGFLEGVRDFDLLLPPERHLYGGFTIQTGHDCMEGLLKSGERPRAVFAANDEMALGALRAIQEHGLRVPEDVALIGFDDIPYTTFAMPPLSTVRRPLYNLGEAAIDLLLTLMTTRTASRCRTLSTEIVLRGTLV
jgi:LacI family transcriptional regulator